MGASDCDWVKITAGASWCSAHGTLRTGTWKGTEYCDPETGEPIKQSTTGYYRPGLSGGLMWEEGPVPYEYQVDVYDEPYEYMSAAACEGCPEVSL